MPPAAPRTVSATREMVGAPSTISNVTVAETSRWSGVAPASASSCENAIAKQLACAAAISSSGLVVAVVRSVRPSS